MQYNLGCVIKWVKGVFFVQFAMEHFVYILYIALNQFM